jgi:SAM-dependent methyltransferase
VAEASDYSLDRMAAAGRYNEWLLDRARPYLGTRVLEVGAGIGTFTPQLAEGREVVAVEPDPALAAQPRGRAAGATVVEGEVGDAPPGPYDSAVCFNVLEHIPDHAAALTSFRERLRPGGHLLLLVPAHPFLFGPIDKAFEHERRYAKRSLGSLLRETGYEAGQPGRRARLARHWADPATRRDPWGATGRLRPARAALPPPRPRGAALGLSLWAVARRPAQLV